MKKLFILLGAMLILVLAVAPAIAVVGGDMQQVDDLAINEECTIGVNHASITTHDSPVLWKVGDGPEILVGNPEGSVGEKYVFFTGGTSPGPEAIKKLARAGVSTIIGMHMGEKLQKECEGEGLYVVIAGHPSSDCIGMNIILDELEKDGLKSYQCSGFTRHKRK